MAEDIDRGGGVGTHWLWTTASATLFLWAMRSYRGGYAGDSRLMPFKAFGVASLFLGGSTAASIAFLQASGIHKVEDVIEVGANMRTRLGISSKKRDEKTDDS